MEDAEKKASTKGRTKRQSKTAIARETAALVDRCTIDLTNLVREGKLRSRMVREDEVEATLEALCWVRRGSVALVGQSAFAFRSLVEAVAARLAFGRVPSLLVGRRLVMLGMDQLSDGVDEMEELIARMGRILEAVGAQPTILWIDETWAIRSDSDDDLDPLKLRKMLADWDQPLLVSATESELRRTVDLACFVNRFTRVRVRSVSEEEALPAVLEVRDELVSKTGVQVDEAVIRALVRFADRNLPTGLFPAKASRLLDHCVAAAAVQQQKELTEPFALRTARRAIGLADASPQKLERLRKKLVTQGLVPDEEAKQLCSQLAAASAEDEAGAAAGAERPPPVVLLLGPAAGNTEEVSALVAAEVFGDERQVVSIDLGRFDEPTGVQELAATETAYSREGPLRQLVDRPASVLCLKNVDGAHFNVRALLARAFERGVLRDADGRKILLGHAIVVLGARTVPADANGGEPLGFSKLESSPGAALAPGLRPRATPSAVARAALGTELAAQCDVVVAGLEPRTPQSDLGKPVAAADVRTWLRRDNRFGFQFEG